MAAHRVYYVEHRNYYCHDNGKLDCQIFCYATSLERAKAQLRRHFNEGNIASKTLFQGFPSWWMEIWSEQLDAYDPDPICHSSYDWNGELLFEHNNG